MPPILAASSNNSRHFGSSSSPLSGRSTTWRNVLSIFSLFLAAAQQHSLQYEGINDLEEIKVGINSQSKSLERPYSANIAQEVWWGYELMLNSYIHEACDQLVKIEFRDAWVACGGIVNKNASSSSLRSSCNVST